MITKRNQTLLRRAIDSNDPVSGLTHNFYKYPARFSPVFSRAVIEAFTQPGEVVYDPFMGGATTIVEATSLGRRAVGTDINSLAVFLADVKTTALDDMQIFSVRRWAADVAGKLNLWTEVPRAVHWAESGYQRNISDRKTWRIRKLLEIALADIEALRTVEEQRFARCILLKTGQWALDCRKECPSIHEFREQFLLNTNDMARSVAQYARTMSQSRKLYGNAAGRPVCLQRSAIGIEDDPVIAACRPISLVLTSPPYPGVHVLYHRWQVQGRRETPAPFWIADCLDGNGASYYTFGSRGQVKHESYFKRALAAFRSLAKVVSLKTVVVQMIAFSEPKRQLPRYLKIMERAGFTESKFPEIANQGDGRVWRAVPNRKWYASQRGVIPSSNEVVLFHRLSS